MEGSWLIMKTTSACLYQTSITVSGITKWDCQQCGVRQGVCMYATTSVLCGTVNSSDQHEHTWCTNLPHNRLSPHWARTHRLILHWHRSRRKCSPSHTERFCQWSCTRHSSDCARNYHIHIDLHLERSWEEYIGREMCVHDGEQFVPITYTASAIPRGHGIVHPKLYACN